MTLYFILLRNRCIGAVIAHVKEVNAKAARYVQWRHLRISVVQGPESLREEICCKVMLRTENLNSFKRAEY